MTIRTSLSFYPKTFQYSQARAQTPSTNGDQARSSVTFKCFKLPYAGSFSIEAERRLRKVVKRFCNDLDIKLAFPSFKIRNIFSVKDPVPSDPRSRVEYKFTCAGCNACYVGETFGHISTRIQEYQGRDRPSYIFQHLQHSEERRRVCFESCFSILDIASNRFQLFPKETAHIRWKNPNLNREQKHAELTLSFQLYLCQFS